MKPIDNLKKAYQNLDEEKKRLKEMNSQVKDGCANSHRFNEIAEKIAELRAEAKQIKESVIDDLRLRDDINEAKQEIKDQKALITDLTVNLMIEGGFNPYEEITVGDLIITPKVSVTYKKQLSMKF